ADLGQIHGKIHVRKVLAPVDLEHGEIALGIGSNHSCDIDVIVIGTNFGRLAYLDDMIVRDRITVSRDEKSRPLGGHETVAIVVAQTVASTGALKRESRFVVGNTN